MWWRMCDMARIYWWTTMGGSSIDPGDCTTKILSNRENRKLFLVAKLCYMKEWEAPESNKITAGLLLIENIPRTTWFFCGYVVHSTTANITVDAATVDLWFWVWLRLSILGGTQRRVVSCLSTTEASVIMLVIFKEWAFPKWLAIILCPLAVAPSWLIFKRSRLRGTLLLWVMLMITFLGSYLHLRSS